MHRRRSSEGGAVVVVHAYKYPVDPLTGRPYDASPRRSSQVRRPKEVVKDDETPNFDSLVTTAIDAIVEAFVSEKKKKKTEEDPVDVVDCDLLDPPAFDWADVEAAQRDFNEHFRFDRVATKEPLRRHLESHAVVRLMGLAAHVCYWHVLRPGFLLRRGRDIDDAIKEEEGTPTKAEQSQLVAEALACYAELHLKSTVSLAVVHLALHTSVERLLRGQYPCLSHQDCSQMHDYLSSLFDPHSYHAEYLSNHLSWGSRPRGDNKKQQKITANLRAARLRERKFATSTAVHALFPRPASPRARRSLGFHHHQRKLSDDDKKVTLPTIDHPDTAARHNNDMPFQPKAPADILSGPQDKTMLFERLRAASSNKKKHALFFPSSSPENAPCDNNSSLNRTKRAKRAQLAREAAFDRRGTWRR